MRWLVLIFLLSISFALADSEFIDFGNIPDQELFTGENKQVLDLDDYYNGTDLFYKFKPGADGLEGIEISIDEGQVDIFDMIELAIQIGEDNNLYENGNWNDINRNKCYVKAYEII